MRNAGHSNPQHGPTLNNRTISILGHVGVLSSVAENWPLSTPIVPPVSHGIGRKTVSLRDCRRYGVPGQGEKMHVRETL